ncbi:MAG: hypothetical protein A3F67_03360 [Verrucomicrobia bacterium RIFCSPHIGHO2_12_FULL_41_10]|nr:MAG: hypothetical protein A3F67_03360 [Verrucomicrobia bacterium RIFCSPHIGHO2_12_FULL_41_10]HLB34846.1 glycosyltransferase family 4 protein [Chthoniobacterales bacterium]
MNILFVLYGGFETNSSILLTLFAKELTKRGHQCAIVIHSDHQEGVIEHQEYISSFHPAKVLENPGCCFKNNRRADIIHAWTPRQNVCQFVLDYQAHYPTPLLIYSEDNEEWISTQFIDRSGSKIEEETEASLQMKIPTCLSHPYNYKAFLGLADAAAIIIPKLVEDIPSWLFYEVIMTGVDLDYFYPRSANNALKEALHLKPQQKIIVYCGGVNQFTAQSIKSLCQMVFLLNKEGCSCRLLRSGREKLSIIPGITAKELKYVSDLGILPRSELPNLMSLADVFVQPGVPSPFEELRLPCKIPEFMAMGIPTILPNCNIASLMTHGEDALIHETGALEEITTLCKKVFCDEILTRKLKEGARQFAVKYFDYQQKVDQLEKLYQKAMDQYHNHQSQLFWESNSSEKSPSRLFVKKLHHLLQQTESFSQERQKGITAELAAVALDFQERLCLRDRQFEHLKKKRKSKIARLFGY